MHKPDKDYKIYAIVKILGFADTFSRGIEKLSMAENTSDISTDDPKEANLKRRRRAQKIFSDEEEKEKEESESDGDDVCDISGTTKDLPPFPILLKTRYERKENSASSSGSSLKRICEPDWNTNTQKKKITAERNKSLEKIVENNTASQVNDETLILYNSDNDVKNDQNNSENENESISLIQSVQHCSKVLMEQNGQEIDFSLDTNKELKRNSFSNTASEKHCDSSLQVMLKKIIQLLVENNLRGKKCEQMLQNLTKKKNINKQKHNNISEIINVDTDSFSPEYLPAQTLEDFHAAEDKWKTNKNYRENVLELFAKCKMHTLLWETYTIMGKLMSDSVAMLYSWTGAKQNKEKLEESPFRKVLETYIIQLHNDATLNGIKKCITDWLRHAKERYERRSSARDGNNS